MRTSRKALTALTVAAALTTAAPVATATAQEQRFCQQTFDCDLSFSWNGGWASISVLATGDPNERLGWQVTGDPDCWVSFWVSSGRTYKRCDLAPGAYRLHILGGQHRHDWQVNVTP